MAQYKVRNPFTLRLKEEGGFERIHKSGDIVSLSDEQLKKYGHMVEVYAEPETASAKRLTTKTEVS